MMTVGWCGRRKLRGCKETKEYEWHERETNRLGACEEGENQRVLSLTLLFGTSVQVTPVSLLSSLLLSAEGGGSRRGRVY
jgi:hypothetical protein